jgi:aryl-alcohol dehydrogenase-like predicted oxidoreductase
MHTRTIYLMRSADARDHGLRTFSVYQGRWSAAERDFERDIIPMTRDEGMALCPWGALGGGNFTVQDKEKTGEQGRNFRPQTEEQKRVSEKLATVAKSKNTLITSVALAYVMHKTPYVVPIVGGRKVDHLKGNIEALGLQLSEEEIDDIDSAIDFDVGFPMSFLFEFGGEKYNTRMTSSDVGLLKFAGQLDSHPHPQPVKPHGL